MLMKLATMALATAFVLSGSLAFAQTTHPAPSTNSTKDTSGMTPDTLNGSGTSTSGGKDANGDQGRDKMPESSNTVKPSPGKPNIPDPNSKIK
jgi:hypothetical protein